MKKREIDTKVSAELLPDGRIEVSNTVYVNGQIRRVARTKFRVTAIAGLLERLGWKKPEAPNAP